MTGADEGIAERVAVRATVVAAAAAAGGPAPPPPDHLASTRHLRNKDALVTRVQELMRAGGGRRAYALFKQAAQFDGAYVPHSTLLNVRQFTRAMRAIVTGVSEADVDAAVRAVAATHSRPVVTTVVDGSSSGSGAEAERINYAEFINAVCNMDPTIGFQVCDGSGAACTDTQCH